MEDNSYYNVEDGAFRVSVVCRFREETLAMILAIWGEEKTGKSALALSFPDPLVHFDFDYGYDRVADSTYGHKLINGRSITTNPYTLPVQFGGRKMEGAKELWLKFLKDYLKALEDKEVKTIALDTGTQVWEVDKSGFLQERQERDVAAGKVPREAILQIEYGEPNARMRSIYNAARGYKKHLVVTHYSRDEYRPRLNPQSGMMESASTGKLQLAGFGETPNMVDLVIYTYKVEKGKIDSPDYSQQLWGVITTSGLGIELCGNIIQDVTYEKIVNLQKMLKGEV